MGTTVILVDTMVCYFRKRTYDFNFRNNIFSFSNANSIFKVSDGIFA